MTAERITHLAPLGLRLWDDSAGTIVTDEIEVHATSVTSASVVRVASRSASGFFVFHSLPGLSSFERGELGMDTRIPPAPTRRFQVTISHRRGEFLPIRFQCDAPQWGFARPLVALLSARPLNPISMNAPLPSVPLFPAVTRPVRGGMAVVRAELRIADARKTPAAWALVEASSDGKTIGRALTDTMGRILLVFPFPHLDVLGQPGSPAPPVTWEVSFSVYHDTIAGIADHADLDEVMAFNRRPLRSGGAGNFTDTLTRELHPNRPLDLGALELKP